ncbi:hypothetical protein ACM26W_05435 [Halomonas sp. HK25]|uniref:hypothetical protein n=1 Tax=Halomonas sp. HK25 TaxID=3394321 RepID=UPI0039FD4F23
MNSWAPTLPSLLAIGGLLLSLLLIGAALYRRGEQHRRALLGEHHIRQRALERRDQFFTLSLELLCRVDLSGCFL